MNSRTMHLRVRTTVLCCSGLLAAAAGAQLPTPEAQTNALAAIRAQRADGLIAVQPWAQLLGPDRLGIGWLTSDPAGGVVEWTQSEIGDDWRDAWFSADGLRQANGTMQRAVIAGFDPAKPLRFRARSRAITSFKPYKVEFGPPVISAERRLPALTRPGGAVSFLVFNDTHSRVGLYPLLTEKGGPPVDFAVFNGDVLQDPQTEQEVTDYLLSPMAWFASKSMPCFFLRGNHETRGAFARRLKDYLLLPDGRYYAAMTFGVTRVLFLDTGEDKPDSSPEYSGLVDFEPYLEEELVWLRGEIASEAFRQATWRVVVMHIPPDWRPDPAKLWHGARRVRERFAPLFDQGRVTAVISGHNHRPELIEPCPDPGRGFQWPVFIGGAPALTNATVIRVEADASSLKITRFASDGTIGAERTWRSEAASSPEPLNWTTPQDHRNMMEQLGITRLRPGRNAQVGATNAANYDPALANPYPDLPELLTLKNGTKVTTPEQWWQQRRPEIVEDLEREVYGRVPKQVPKVTWTVVSNVVSGLVGDLEASGKRLVGHVDNSACPSITVDIRMTVVTPTKAKGPVPLLMMFGGFGGDGLPRPPGTPAPTNRFRDFGGPFADPPSTEQLLAAGWGYAIINPGSIQPDNGAGLTKGVIGLVNKGQPRKPDDWGALRAWAWGAARGLDYLETDPTVDSKKVGIEGVSRFGKAALVTMAFEPRFALVLVGSSGQGGAKLHRRNFGEAVENLTGSGGYHWMAGNYLKYGAAESSFGSKNASDLPVDAHMLIALCAPRPTFISYGIPERGDAHWLDQQGSYMAAVAAGEAFRLLGARDLGEREDYRTAKMPPVNTGLLEGELAWRQHDGGHEDRSNMKHFIAWANPLLHHVPPPAAEPK